MSQIILDRIQVIEKKIDTISRMAFLEGQVQGIRDYAIWRNGEQLVGCLEKPLKEVIAPMVEEIKQLREKL